MEELLLGVYMNKKERFHATINREKVDRPASWLGIPSFLAINILLNYFKVNNIIELKEAIDDDIYFVGLPYNSPESKNICSALNFSNNKSRNINNFDRTLTAPGFFENYTDPDRVEEFNWPDPKKYIDTKECKKIVYDVPNDFAIMGLLWSAHFQDTCSAFGMETALIKMLTNPEIVRIVNEKIINFYLEANEIFYNATANKIDAVLIGDDVGSQNGLMISPKIFRDFVLPGTKKLVSQAKDYGLKVIFHSCGSIYDIIPDLIKIGVDAIHPMQVEAKDMNPWKLKKDFGKSVSFCGGIDAQHFLVNEKPKYVKKNVLEIKKIFPTGLIISPSHEVILPDIPPENIEALFRAVKE